MKPLIIALLLAAPFAQQAPTTHDQAQRIVRAEAERWRFPLVDDADRRYPDIFGTIVTSGNAPYCQTNYTISYAAFARDGQRHAAVVREVEMVWSKSVRHALVNGTVVTLTWRTGGNSSFEWNLETETPERAQSFAAAADFLTDLCTEPAR